MRVVIIGTGRIGCGYLAPLFARAGWEVTLAARTKDTTRRINSTKKFRVVTIGGDVDAEHYKVRGCRAVTVGRRKFVDALAGADLVCISVGVGNVTALGQPLAAALAGRTPQLDIWVVENADAAPDLEAAVNEAAAAAGLALPPLGFAGAVASVAVARGGWQPGVAPEFVGDRARALAVDGSRLLTGAPTLPGVAVTRYYRTRLREKLFVFNAGHAILGYLGWLRRHGTVAEAAADPFLRPIVAGCMLESRRALVAAHPELDGEVEGPVSDALRRFANVGLGDPITRVARDPIRKLRPDDRLLGPVAVIRSTTGTVPGYFALSVAGALLYRGRNDPQAGALEDQLRTKGVMVVLAEVCGLPADDPFADAVAGRYRGFAFDDDETLFPPVNPGELVGVASAGA